MPPPPIDPLTRSLIEKAGYENGFENAPPAASCEAHCVPLSSARHSLRAEVEALAGGGGGLHLRLQGASHALLAALAQDFPTHQNPNCWDLRDEPHLGALLRAAAALARELPAEPPLDASTHSDSNVDLTEALALRRLRLGQERYRQALLDYWGGACAVTALALPAILRASHARPWAQCTSDKERLDPFNGFLLVPNLDALFDRFLISFDPQGLLLTSPQLPPALHSPLGLHPRLRLRWLAPQHHPYLDWHRAHFQAQCT